MDEPLSAEPKRSETEARERLASSLMRAEDVAASVLLVRGHKVLLDSYLAPLYGVKTKVLLQAVKRNIERFPPDFMIQLTAAEWSNLRSQFVTSSLQHGGRRHRPFVFTEQGVAMLSTVVRSDRAIAVNIQIMRSFVRMRRVLASNTELARKLAEIERRVLNHDQAIAEVLAAIRELMSPGVSKRRPIGFTADVS